MNLSHSKNILPENTLIGYRVTSGAVPITAQKVQRNKELQRLTPYSICAFIMKVNRKRFSQPTPIPEKAHLRLAKQFLEAYPDLESEWLEKVIRKVSVSANYPFTIKFVEKCYGFESAISQKRSRNQGRAAGGSNQTKFDPGRLFQR